MVALEVREPLVLGARFLASKLFPSCAKSRAGMTNGGVSHDFPFGHVGDDSRLCRPLMLWSLSSNSHFVLFIFPGHIQEYSFIHSMHLKAVLIKCKP